MLQLCALETFGRTGLQIGVSGRVLLSLVLKTFFRTLSSKTVFCIWFPDCYQVYTKTPRRTDCAKVGCREPQNIPLIPLRLREVELDHGNVGA